MKFAPIFISAGISFTLLIGCNQTQKQESPSSSNDDIVWKANLSYCLSTEKPDAGSLKYGLERENIEMYNFKITEEKGNFKSLMKLLYDSARSKTYPIYFVNPVTGLSPDQLMNEKDRKQNFNDTLIIPATGKYILISDYFPFIKGLNINHEWLYDAKVGSLKSTITDLSLLEKFSGDSPFCSIDGFKFSNRTIDSLGTDQPGLISDITWGRELLMPIIDSGQGPKQRADHNWYYKDSLLKFTVNGESSNSFPLFSQPIRTNFNKKLAEWIWLAARSGQLPAYSCVGADKIGDQIPLKDLKNLGARTDTVTDEHGKPFTVKMQIDASELTGLELKEEVSFHQKSFSFESKITYAGVLVECINKNNGMGVPNNSTILYWVKLN